MKLGLVTGSRTPRLMLACRIKPGFTCAQLTRQKYYITGLQQLRNTSSENCRLLF